MTTSRPATADLVDLVCDDPESRQALEQLVFLLETPETLVKEDSAWRGFTDRIQALISKNRRLLALAERNQLLKNEEQLTSEGIPEDVL